jgi:hypothetical protein
VSRRSRGRPGTVRARSVVILLACIGLALALGVAALSAASSSPSFAGPRHYAAGRLPESLVVGDLNGDGARDVATANKSGRSVSVFLNRGDGSFSARHDYPTGRFPGSLAIGDLDGDGRADLATANSGAGTVSVFLNKGDGSLQARHDYRAGGTPRSIAIGDLNGDRKPDLASANDKRLPSPHRGTVSVFLNRGDGSFSARRDYRTGRFPVSLAIGDLNGDRKPDLVSASRYTSTVSVLLNKGDGSLRARRAYPAGERRPDSVALGDLNGDRKPDLAIASTYSFAVSVLLNRGEGRFRVDRKYAIDPASSEAAYSVVLVDLNGDGMRDLLVATDLGASVFVNRADGSFEAGVVHPTERAPFGAYAGFPVSARSGDLNGDGRRDLVTANLIGNNISVLINRPGLCAVQYVEGKPLPEAKREMTRAGCRIGTITVSRGPAHGGSVISQKPTFGAVLPKGGEVDLVVSRG